MSLVFSVADAATRLPEIIKQAQQLNEEMDLVSDGEVVAKITPVFPKLRTGPEIAADMGNWPHLTPEEADAYAADLDEVRASIPPPISAWDRF